MSVYHYLEERSMTEDNPPAISLLTVRKRKMLDSMT